MLSQLKKFFRGLSVISAVFFIFIFLAALVAFIHLIMPVSIEEKWKEVKIPEGVTYSQGISILEKEGMVKNKFMFLLLGRITGVERKLRAGFYNINTSMTPLEIFNRLRKGMIVEYSVTIPEGATLDDIKTALEVNGLIDDTSWELVRDKDFLRSLKIDAPSLEGYIFPDTYNFAKGAEPENILSIMVQKMREKFNEPMKEKAQELKMSEKEILTVASIIEKEAIVNRDRPLISAVLYNRLKKKMRLQMDPTVVYGIKRPSLRIRKTDLRRHTPYNTYVISGLPPGPIASPGLKSILAALYPAKVNYLYFVSKNDGTHYFSNTWEEHAQAVLTYQRNSQDNSQNDEEKTDQTDNPRKN
jgi:UPF0755 protein